MLTFWENLDVTSLKNGYIFFEKMGGGGGVRGVQLNIRCLKKYTKLIKRKLKIKILISINNV